MMTNQTMIEYQNLTKIYDSKVALDNFVAKINRGEIVALLGPNGSGKTTLMNITVGILKPTSGDVIIGGHSILREPIEAKKLIGFVPEKPFIYEMLSGYENIRFVLDLWDIDASEKENEIMRLAQILEIGAELDNLVSTYSEGMRRKVALIMALIHDPEVLIIDEVTANLDPKALASLEMILKGLRDKGVAILFSTHILEVAEAIADRIIIIQNGRKIWEGEESQLEEAKESVDLKELFFKLTGGPEYEMIREYLRLREARE